jgi:hypothetical protein
VSVFNKMEASTEYGRERSMKLRLICISILFALTVGDAAKVAGHGAQFEPDTNT